MTQCVFCGALFIGCHTCAGGTIAGNLPANYPVAVAPTHQSCDCHDCTQARWKQNVIGQISGALASQPTQEAEIRRIVREELERKEKP